MHSQKMKQLYDAKGCGSYDGSLIELVSKAPQLQKKKSNAIWFGLTEITYCIRQGHNVNSSWFLWGFKFSTILYSRDTALKYDAKNGEKDRENNHVKPRLRQCVY